MIVWASPTAILLTHAITNEKKKKKQKATLQKMHENHVPASPVETSPVRDTRVNKIIYSNFDDSLHNYIRGTPSNTNKNAYQPRAH
jgi:hypothetical protein